MLDHLAEGPVGLVDPAVAEADVLEILQVSVLVDHHREEAVWGKALQPVIAKDRGTVDLELVADVVDQPHVRQVPPDQVQELGRWPNGGVGELRL